MRKLLVYVVLGAGLYGGWNTWQGKSAWGGARVDARYADNTVIVYGATGCSYTAQVVRELGRAGVPFQAYMVDRDPARAAEIKEKLSHPPYAGQGYPTPIVEVNGRILPTPDNISIDRIREQLHVSAG